MEVFGHASEHVNVRDDHLSNFLCRRWLSIVGPRALGSM